ncbi:hypothetical protein [Mesorhizobium sp.]|uniref:hypothetical protein n=1 Tax=Mesorhizobium sp. TaxID=1871066 RepID=UPI0025E3311D|nr:hypothetical protein [Mesorhizobium sp.]
MFKSKLENKGDATTQAARSIIDDEAAARAAKTARLKAARLAQQQEAKPAKAKTKGKR